LLACLMIVPALLAAGCGSDKTASTPATTSTSDIPSKGSSFSGSPSDSAGASAGTTARLSASDSAKQTLDNCLQGADQIPDVSASKRAGKQCRAAYKNIKDAIKTIDAKTAEARAKCVEAANSIGNAEAKSTALQACQQFK
jgi:hypothetical protein